MTEQAPGFTRYESSKMELYKISNLEKDGKVVGRFAPQTKPVDLEVEIEEGTWGITRSFHLIKNASKNYFVL